MNCILGHRLLSFLLLMLLACTRRRHSRHAKPYPKVILQHRKHIFGSLGGCELHSGPPIALLPTAHASCLHPQAPQSARQILLLMLLACTRRRHSRHAKPYPKVILERRRHLFRSFAECELHSGPPKYCLLSFLLLTLLCLRPQAPRSACQTIPKSNFRASKTHFRISRGV